MADVALLVLSLHIKMSYFSVFPDGPKADLDVCIVRSLLLL